MTTVLVPDFLQKLLYDLETISKLGENQRLNTTNEYISIESESTFNGIYRAVSGDSRRRTLHAVSDTINASIELADRITESKHLSIYDTVNNLLIKPKLSELFNQRVEWLNRIHDSLSISINGINILSDSTYHNDTDIAIQLKLLINDIKLSLERIALTLSELSIKKLTYDDKCRIQQLIGGQNNKKHM